MYFDEPKPGLNTIALRRTSVVATSRQAIGSAPESPPTEPFNPQSFKAERLCVILCVSGVRLIYYGVGGEEMSENLLEIRWHGRGGQGVKTAATLFAGIAIDEGKFSQGFPEYGPERMGAPVTGYTRIDTTPIRRHCSIEEPDVVVVLDETLLDVVDVTEGLGEGSAIIVNSPKPPEELAGKIDSAKYRIYTVDATRISVEEIGRPIPNTPMMGALVKVAGYVSLGTLEKQIEKKFLRKLGSKGVEGNIRAIRRAYEEVRGG